MRGEGRNFHDNQLISIGYLVQKNNVVGGKGENNCSGPFGRKSWEKSQNAQTACRFCGCLGGYMRIFVNCSERIRLEGCLLTGHLQERHLQCRRNLLMTRFVSKTGFVGHIDRVPRRILIIPKSRMVVGISGRLIWST